MHILENRQYTGCAVNFMTTTVSYKVHKTIYNLKEKQQIIPNMQEPIITEEQWLQVQEIRKNRIRPTATGRTSLFARKVFCADCGSKLHFCAAKSLRPDQEFYRCANYKDGRGKCKIHYIRNVVLKRSCLRRSAISSISSVVTNPYSCICWQRNTIFFIKWNTKSSSSSSNTAKSVSKISTN
ncbi:MAG: recombinase zinc beta ribbon domain-containing protein [Clostridia bacterium]|nr:recombinase zinc beta ribbon domain-containing protein [Clostridia bacterium]